MDIECVHHEYSGSLGLWLVYLSIYKNVTDSKNSGLWRHPRNRTSQYIDVEYWTDLAKILEAGKFHGLFIADVLSHYGVYKGAGNIDPGLPGAAQFPITDPA